MAQVILALGSNIPPAKENIDRALAALPALGTVKEVAPFIISKPEGFEHQDDFVNTVAILSTPYAPMALLKKLKELEKQLGRTPTFKNGPRVIDLDILFYDNQEIFEDEPDYFLIVPHPRIAEREFVLKPLSYILPDYEHPTLKKPIYRLYRELMKKKGCPTCKIL